MNWLESPVETPILPMDDEGIQYALCIYANHLMNNGSLFCRRIKSGTIQKYIKHSAELLQRASSTHKDFRKDNQMSD